MKRLFLFAILFIGLSGVAGPALADDKTSEAFNAAYGKYNELIQAGDLKSAEPFAVEALKLGREHFGPESTQVGVLAYNLGFLLNRIGKFSSAEKPLREALSIWEKEFGPEDERLLDVCMELGHVFVQTNQINMAKTLFRRAESIAQRTFGEKDSLIVDLNLEMANMTYVRDPHTAQSYFEKTYDLGSEIFPEGNYRTAQAAFGLGKVYLGSANRKKAEQYFLEAIEIFENSPPKDPVWEMYPHSFLVQIYIDQKREDEAAEHLIAIGNVQQNRDISDYQPVYRTQLVYPRAAQDDGKEGEVLIELTVSPEGKVVDPVVIESTDSIFEKTALETIKKWRYAPQVANGEPVETPGVRYKIIFVLED